VITLFGLLCAAFHRTWIPCPVPLAVLAMPRRPAADLVLVQGGEFLACLEAFLTYEQLQALTSEERREHFRASIVLDPDSLPDRGRDHVKALSARLDARTREREEPVRGHAS